MTHYLLEYSAWKLYEHDGAVDDLRVAFLLRLLAIDSLAFEELVGEQLGIDQPWKSR